MAVAALLIGASGAGADGTVAREGFAGLAGAPGLTPTPRGHGGNSKPTL